jgi:hypothetical protein
MEMDRIIKDAFLLCSEFLKSSGKELFKVCLSSRDFTDVNALIDKQYSEVETPLYLQQKGLLVYK